MEPQNRAVAGALAATGVAALAGVAGVPLAWPLAVLLLGAAGVLWLRPRIPGLFVPLAVALGVRSIVAVLHWTVLPLPDDSMDAVGFDQMAWAMAQGPLQGPPLDTFLYSWFLSLAYRVMGHEPLAGESFNVLLGTSIVLSAALLARNLWGERAGRAAAWTTALFPTLILYSVVLMREALIVAPLVMGTWTWMVWWKTSRPLPAVATVALWSIPAFLQMGLMFLAPSMAILALLRPLLRRMRSPQRVAAVVLFVPLYLGGIFVGSAMGLWLQDPTPEPPAVPQPVAPEPTPGEEPEQEGNETTPPSNGTSKQPPPDEPDRFGGIQEAQLVRTHGRAAYPSWMVVDSWSGAVLVGPFRVLMLLFAPLPWMVTAPKDALGLLDAMLFMAVAAGLWRGRRAILSSERALLVTAVALIGLAIFAMGTSNYGTGIRHRAKFAPLLLALLPEAAWMVRLPGRPEGSTLLGDLLSVQGRVEGWLSGLNPRARTR